MINKQFWVMYIMRAAIFCSIFLPSVVHTAHAQNSTMVAFPTQTELLTLKQLEDKVDADVGSFAGDEQDFENSIARSLSQQEQLLLQARAISSAQQLVVDEQAVVSAYPQNSNILNMESNLVALFQQIVVSNQNLYAQMKASNNLSTWAPALNATLNTESSALAGIAEKVGILFIDNIPDMPQFIVAQYGSMQNAVNATTKSISLLELQK